MGSHMLGEHILLHPCPWSSQGLEDLEQNTAKLNSSTCHLSWDISVCELALPEPSYHCFPVSQWLVGVGRGRLGTAQGFHPSLLFSHSGVLWFLPLPSLCSLGKYKGRYLPSKIVWGMRDMPSVSASLGPCPQLALSTYYFHMDLIKS